MSYPVVERFISINGEGRNAGALAVFLRFAGCNLSCSYCDTGWANAPDCPVTRLDADELCQYVRETGLRHVTVTGGEPLLQANMADLLVRLAALPEVQVEVETNGSIELAPFIAAAPLVSFTADYKLAGSGMEGQMCLAHFHALRACDTLKFVCSSQADLERACALLAGDLRAIRAVVYLSAAFAEISPAEIVDFMKNKNLRQVKLQLQMHKFIWPIEERGV